MVGKTSVSMMVFLVIVVASLTGISSIHQYVEGQKPPASRGVGTIVQVTSYAPVAGCIVSVILASNVPSPPGVQPGDSIILFSEREYLCFTWCVENDKLRQRNHWIQRSKNDSFKPTSLCTGGTRA
jgi:hypothetical protein